MRLLVLTHEGGVYCLLHCSLIQTRYCISRSRHCFPLRGRQRSFTSHDLARPRLRSDLELIIVTPFKPLPFTGETASLKNARTALVGSNAGSLQMLSDVNFNVKQPTFPLHQSGCQTYCMVLGMRSETSYTQSEYHATHIPSVAIGYYPLY